MSARGLNLLVFRDGRRRVPGAELRRALTAQVAALSGRSSFSDTAIAALLRAGELECGVADADITLAKPFAQLTDSLATLLLTGRLPSDWQQIRAAVDDAPVPESLNVSVHEGFAYYALHPLAYADVLKKLDPLSEKAVVVGIRSIGTTLSAVTASAARLRGAEVERITVRPEGHPYNRKLEFSADGLRIIQNALFRKALFLIVDEGPGLSGSSFLSVAEALEAAGVEQRRIVLLCGHDPNPDALCSTNAAQRWRRFQSLPVTAEVHKPADAGIFIGAGEWRRKLFASQSDWPAGWTNMERLKFLTDAGGTEIRLFKFAGLGHYGDAVFEHEQRLAAAGFGPPVCRERHGFVTYPWLNARPMGAQDLSTSVLARLAEYCAFRAHAFHVADADLAPLQEMAEHNLCHLGFDLPVVLKLERPVIADGRMQPHEWLLTREGSLFKTDGSSHGDDHFYPGPTDIAWDLAGAIVEWQMNAGQAAEFLNQYRWRSSDDAQARIQDFIRAYTVFRSAYCRMAASAMQGTAEETRLETAADGYADLLRREARKACVPGEGINPPYSLAAEPAG